MYESTIEYDTSNPNILNTITFISENRRLYKKEIHRCLNICICTTTVVVVLFVIGLSLTIFYSKKT